MLPLVMFVGGWEHWTCKGCPPYSQDLGKLERVPEPAERAGLVKIHTWEPTYHFSTLTCFREHFAKQTQNETRRDWGNVSLQPEEGRLYSFGTVRGAPEGPLNTPLPLTPVLQCVLSPQPGSSCGSFRG